MTTRGFHPRRVPRLRHISRSSRGCDSRRWQNAIRLAPAVGRFIDRAPDERAFFELDDLLRQHSRELFRLHWHLPQGALVRTNSKLFSIRTLCTSGQRLDSLVDWKAH